MSPTLLPLLLSAAAGAWPLDGDWAPVTRGGTPIADPTGDPAAGTGATDIVGDATHGAVLWWTDGTSLFLRMRLDADPRPPTGTPPLDDSPRGFILDTDGDPSTYELVLLAAPHGAAVQLHAGTGDAGWTVPIVETPSTVVADPFGSGSAQIVPAGSGPDGASGDEDWFLDLQLPWLDLASAAGIDETTPFSITAATEVETDEPLGFSTDLAGVDNALGPLLDDALGDPVAIDRDGDGLTGFEEETLGTDPTRADSDEDGLSDPEEIAFGTDPLGPDTDGDGARDGDEVTGGTDPLTVDTDGDGISDGAELECGGDTPDDRDADGIPDVEELPLGDSDGDDAADWCDDDDDGDGIPTLQEGASDTDGDGLPDHLDPDSDDDGESDAVEGTDDDDCDTTPNYVDANDLDGPCGDPDEDGLGNADEADCGTDPTQPDTDGDGILDGDESCVDDSDGDGLIDVLDDTDDPGEAGGLAPPGDDLYGFTGGDFTGGSCSSLPGTAMLGPSMLLAVVALRRRRNRGALLTAGVATISPVALAQEFNADRLRPAIGQANLVVTDDAEVGPSGPGSSILLSYADDPLVYRHEDGRPEVAILQRLGTIRALPWWGTRRLRLGLDLPVHVLSEGHGVDGVARRWLGDIGLDGRLRLLDRTDGGLGLAAQARLDVPTGAGRAWLGEAGPGVHVQTNLAWGRRMILATNIGARVGTPEVLDTLELGRTITFDAGAWTPMTATLGAGLELSGERFLGSSGAPGATRVEWLASTRATFGPGLSMFVGGGGGLSQGAGAPDLRAMVGLTWTQPGAPAGDTPPTASLGPPRRVSAPASPPQGDEAATHPSSILGPRCYSACLLTGQERA